MINRIEKGILVHFFCRYSSEAHFLPALQNSTDLMAGTWFYFKLKFSLEILKKRLR